MRLNWNWFKRRPTQAPREQEPSTSRARKKLVLFIHGLGGDAAGTWGKFPKLIGADAELAKLYDVESVPYDTGFFGSQPSLATSAGSLKTAIENRYPSYSDIALIAHSQGGLVARHYIAEWLNSGQGLRVSRLLTFATPHQGSGWATLLRRLPFTSQQVEDLDPNSLFMQSLVTSWGQAMPERRLRLKYVVAADDAIVGPVSGKGPWSPIYEVVSGVGHTALVKPESANDIGFLITKNFLVEESLLPGGVEADYHAPLLRLNVHEANESNRFIYGARVLPFIGRDAEIGKLEDFLGGLEQPFRWMVLYGSGGVGKSRLALELCLAIRDDWHAGFLPQGEDEPGWGRWQPLMPTLIVIDYAARDTKRTGKLLRALSGRGPADGTARLAAPVRALLVERTGKSDWLDKIVGTGNDKARVEATHAPEDLPLLTLSDPWPIFGFVLKEAKKPLPDKTDTLAAFEKIDPERRPLFAYFMADAIADGRDSRHFDAERLLDDVIDRARDKFWKPAGATPMEERLLALVTMTRGLPVSTVKSETRSFVADELLPPWNRDRHPAIFRAMTGRASGEKIAPLEPDIVGEHFTLSCLGQKNLTDADRIRLCDLAWRLNPLGMAQFMTLSHSDLPDDPMLLWVRRLPSNFLAQRGWVVAAQDIIFSHSLSQSYDPDIALALLGGIRSVAATHGDDLMWGAWASMSAALMLNVVRTDQTAARTLVNDMRVVANARDEDSLRESWAMAAIIYCRFVERAARQEFIQSLSPADRELLRSVMERARRGGDPI